MMALNIRLSLTKVNIICQLCLSIIDKTYLCARRLESSLDSIAQQAQCSRTPKRYVVLHRLSCQWGLHQLTGFLCICLFSVSDSQMECGKIPPLLFPRSNLSLPQSRTRESVQLALSNEVDAWYLRSNSSDHFSIRSIESLINDSSICLSFSRSCLRTSASGFDKYFSRC